MCGASTSEYTVARIYFQRAFEMIYDVRSKQFDLENIIN